MSYGVRYISAAVLLIILLIPVRSSADWPENGVALCDTAGAVYRSFIVSDQSGGAIIAWKDQRLPDRLLYVQAIDNDGNLLWASSGVSLSLTAGTSSYIDIGQDGSGGAVLTWVDNSPDYHEDFYVQSISSAGVVQWTDGGLLIVSGNDEKWAPRIVGDGDGGAIIAWAGCGNLMTCPDIFMRSVRAEGTLRFGEGGIVICAAAGEQDYIAVAPDGDSGILIVWEDYRPYYMWEDQDNHIYAQSVSRLGVSKWTVDGVPVCSAAGRRFSPKIISDGAGGALVTWADKRAGNSDIYIQRINSIGNWNWWPGDGVPVCTNSSQQYFPEIVSDGDGGAIITWYDLRNGDYDIYAQAVSNTGAVRWAADGIPVCTATGGQYAPRIVSDGEGGAIISWTDSRNGDYNIYAQSITADGTIRFEADGMPVATAAATSYESYIAEAGTGEAIATWVDERDTIPRVYAVKICEQATDTELSPPADELTLSQNYPNPFNPATTTRYNLHGSCRVVLEIFDVSGRHVATLVDEDQEAGHYAIDWNGRDMAGNAVGSGVYLYRLKVGEEMLSRKMILLR